MKNWLSYLNYRIAILTHVNIWWQFKKFYEKTTGQPNICEE